MNILINQEQYEVPRHVQERLALDLLAQGTAQYKKFDQAWRVVLKPVARFILQKIESEVEKRQGKEVARQIRPPDRNSDPVLHLANVLAAISMEMMKHVDLRIELEHGTNIVEAFNISFASAGETGRQVGLNRD